MSKRMLCRTAEILFIAAALGMLPCCLQEALANATSSAADSSLKDFGFRVIKTFKTPPPYIGSIFSDPTGIYYHDYPTGSNQQDLIQVDPDTGTVKTIASGYDEVNFVAADDRYIVYAVETPGATRRLCLLDRQSGSRICSKRLQRRIAAARMNRDSITIVQEGEVLTLSLRDLSVSARVVVPDDVCASAKWGDKFACFSRSPIETDRIRIVDSDGRVLRRFPFPRPEVQGNSICGQYNVRVLENIGYFDLGCHTVRAIDLSSGAVQFDLDVGGGIAAMTFFKGAMIVSVFEQDSTRSVQAFDLKTRRRIGRIAVTANHLAAGVHGIIAIDDQHWTSPLPAIILEPTF